MPEPAAAGAGDHQHIVCRSPTLAVLPRSPAAPLLQSLMGIELAQVGLKALEVGVCFCIPPEGVCS